MRREDLKLSASALKVIGFNTKGEEKGFRNQNLRLQNNKIAKPILHQPTENLPGSKFRFKLTHECTFRVEDWDVDQKACASVFENLRDNLILIKINKNFSFFEMEIFEMESVSLRQRPLSK